MINDSVINSGVINGNGGEIYASPIESVSVSEDVKVSFNYGMGINETVSINEQVDIMFIKGININETVSINDHQDIVLGNLYLNINDEPVKIHESVSVNLQKGILMEDLILYYLDLLIVQYKSLPKATAHVRNIVRESLCDLLPSILNDKFDMDSAEGDQLDILGKYIGIARRVKTFYQDVTLSDEEYRIILKIKGTKNRLGSSLYDVDNFIAENLSGTILAFDGQNMAISYFMNSSVISNTLAQAIIAQGVLPKPAGVSLASIIYIDSIENIFGFRTYDFFEGTQVGFNSYSSYNSSYRMLSYGDTI